MLRSVVAMRGAAAPLPRVAAPTLVQTRARSFLVRKRKFKSAGNITGPSTFAHLTTEEFVALYDVWKAEGNKFKETTFNDFLTHCAKQALKDPRYVDKAFAIAEDLANDPVALLGEQSYLLLTQACVRALQIDRAFETVEQMRKDGLKVSQQCYVALIRGCAMVDDKQRAMEVFERMVKERRLPFGAKFENLYGDMKNL